MLLLKEKFILLRQKANHKKLTGDGIFTKFKNIHFSNKYIKNNRMHLKKETVINQHRKTSKLSKQKELKTQHIKNKK